MVNILCEYCDVCISADNSQASPEKRLEDMIRLGELCMEVLQQNDEHHSEVKPTEHFSLKSCYCFLKTNRWNLVSVQTISCWESIYYVFVSVLFIPRFSYSISNVIFRTSNMNSPLILWRLFTTYVQRNPQSRRQRINLCLSSGLLALRVAPEGIAWSFQSRLVIIYRLAVHLLRHVAITAVSEWQLTRPMPAHSSGAGKQRPRPICTGPAPANALTSTLKK